MWGWSEYHKFLSDFFCLTAPKNFKKKPSTVALVLGIEISYDKGGYVTISCRFFCLAVPKKFVEEPFCAVFQESSVSQKCVYKRGGKSINIFPSEICSVTVPKLLVLESFDVSSFSGFMSRNSVDLFLSRSNKKYRRGTILCCIAEKFP